MGQVGFMAMRLERSEQGKGGHWSRVYVIEELLGMARVQFHLVSEHLS